MVLRLIPNRSWKNEKSSTLKMYFYLLLFLMKYILFTGRIKFFVLSDDTDFVRLSVRIYIYGMLFLSVGMNLLIHF